MIFPAPIFLYFLPLAGLPVLFHLILKQKKRTVVFPTLMFFYRTDPRLNSHRKIRQWLLLLMRILLIAFMLLALSRPEFVTSAGLGGKISVVAMLDNSGSMSEMADGDMNRTKLECAVEGARRLISTLPDGSKAAAVLLVDDPAVKVGDALTSDKDSLLACLDQIRPTQATGDAARAMTRAFKLLGASSAPAASRLPSKPAGGAVHVFSDLQQSDWGKDSERPETGRSSITVFFHKIKAQTRIAANVAITAIQFPEERILPKHPYTIGLELQNSSNIAANIRVNSADSQDSKNTENVVLEAGRTKAVELQITPDEAGHHWVKAWIEGDGFSADNEAGIGILCGQTATVSFAGKSEEFGVLPVALSPSRRGQFTGMVLEFCPPEQLRQTAGQEEPILIVATWSGLQLARDNWARLQQYVEEGGNLLVVPSATVGRQVFSGQVPNWLGASIKTREVYPQGANLTVLDSEAAFWHRIREATAGLKLEPVSAFAFYPLQLSTEFVPLLGVDQGGQAEGLDRIAPAFGGQKVVIAHRKLGKGNIYVSGTAFASRFNTLPSTGLLVVMAQRMAIAGTSSGEQHALSLVAGERPHGITAQGGQVEILSLVGDPMDWKGKEQEIPAFPNAGVYLLKTDNDKYCISVRASEKEGLEKFVEGSEVPVVGRMAHKISLYDDAESFGQYHRSQARVIELYLFLLLLATLALLAEGWLGAPRPGQGRHSVLQAKALQQRTVSDVPRLDKVRLVSPIDKISRRLKTIIGKSAHDMAAPDASRLPAAPPRGERRGGWRSKPVGRRAS